MQAAGQAADDGRAGASALWRAVRRAQSAAPPAAPAAPPRSADRAIAAAIARAADRVHGLPLFLDRIVTGHALVAELAEVIPDRALILVVQGAGDALGVVAICPGLLTSLIETQAMGRISARAAPDRRPTRTDAVICGDFTDACLAELADELAGLAGFQGLGRFRVASYLDDPRPLALLLDDIPLRRIDAHLRAGPAGERDGMIFLALPVPAVVPALAAPACDAPRGGPEDAAETPPSGGLAETVRTAPLTLHAVLCRRRMSLGELRALAPGDRIALPQDVLDMAALETTAGQPLLRGRLGELSGRHALRLFPAGARPHGAAAAPDDHDPRAGGLTPLAPAGPANAAALPAGATAATLSAESAFAAEPPMEDLAQGDPFRNLSAPAGRVDGPAQIIPVVP